MAKIKERDSCVVGCKNEDTEEKFRERHTQKKLKIKIKIEIHIKKEPSQNKK